MADPLSQLRQFHINGREIKEHNGYIVFGEHGWPKNVNTNYQVYSTDDDKSKKEYYTLECLLYFLRNMDVAHTHYVRQAGCDNKPAVHRPDRKHLLAYLKGESQTAPGIDKNAPIPSLRVPASEIYKKDTTTGAEPQPSTSSQSSNSQCQNDTIRGDSQSSATKRRLPHDEDISRVREEFAARLNEPSTKKLATMPTDGALRSGDANESSAAISKFGAEKLAAMRAKHLAVKRTQIIDADTDPSFGPTEPGGREDLLYAMDADKYKLIKSKEKVWRTRTSILQAQNKEFGKAILNMLNLLDPTIPTKRPHPSMPQMPNDMPMNPSYPQPSGHPQQPQSIQRNTYNRYDQERFVKLDIGVEIDTKKSFVGGVSNGGISGYNQPGTAQPSSRPPSMGSVASNGGTRIPRPHDVVDNRHSRHASATPMRPSKRTSTVPIIVIPATTTSIINMYNASTILQDLTYVEGKPGVKGRENEILIQRKKPDGSCAHYKVIDNPLKLERDDWVRVVAVFVQGPAWQFKGWPYNGSPVEIFSNIKGFHLKWDESKLDDNVAKWNVQVLELSRNKRHLDKANLLKFWSALDNFMMKYKGFLKF